MAQDTHLVNQPPLLVTRLVTNAHTHAQAVGILVHAQPDILVAQLVVQSNAIKRPDVLQSIHIPAKVHAKRADIIVQKVSVTLVVGNVTLHQIALADTALHTKAYQTAVVRV